MGKKCIYKNDNVFCNNGKGLIMMILTGELIQQTDKAVLFRIDDDPLCNLNNRTEWFPKSEIKLTNIGRKKDDTLYLPDWLYDSKIIKTNKEI